ncbi:hypothetical protein GCM10010232_02200 [Streptomyces amakusaensis]|uniref:Bacterial mobilisation domain-containing protein n=1 Tax=Streptomyces amakusaensis TaxID=67271 RepID=A0ABW0ANN2_9ACTN
MRQRAPELGEVGDDVGSASVEDPSRPEQPSWRESGTPVLPALMNRRRTVETRDQVRNIRFTPTAVRIISAEAERRGQRFAGFVGDAALATALGRKHMLGSPEDDPVRPLVAAVEKQITALNKIGNNLNQITGAIHRGTVPERTHAVLDGVDRAVQRSYRLLDEFVAKGVADGA